MQRFGRVLVRLGLMAGLPAAALWIAMEAYLAGGRYVTAENAYVKTDIVNIGSEVDGRVVAVHVDDHEAVAPGQPLFRIDDEPFAIAVATAEAAMAAARQDVQSLRARYRQGEARIRAAQESVRYLAVEHRRQEMLVAEGAGAQVRLDAAAHELATAEHELAVLREQNDVVLVELGGSLQAPVEDQPAFRTALAMHQEAMLDLSRTLVTAPAAGVLSQVALQAGEYVEAGTPVFALVATADPWIEVNLKEVDLTHVEVGQPVSVVIDAYPDTTWPAVVESVSPATGAEFALLPPQNSTGNWVKVVQRVPVRLKLDDGRDTSKLRSGMTVTVSIDTGRARTFSGLVDGVLADVLTGQ